MLCRQKFLWHSRCSFQWISEALKKWVFYTLANCNFFRCARTLPFGIINSQLTVGISHIGVLKPQRIYLVHHPYPVSHLHSFVLLWIPWKEKYGSVKDKTGRTSSTEKAANTENGYIFALMHLVCGFLVSFPAAQSTFPKAECCAHRQGRCRSSDMNTF